MERTPLQVALGQVLVLKKPHPCGGTQWVVTRLGADIGIQCVGCGRKVLLSRSELGRRVKGAGGGGSPPSPSG